MQVHDIAYEDIERALEKPWSLKPAPSGIREVSLLHYPHAASGVHAECWAAFQWLEGASLRNIRIAKVGRGFQATVTDRDIGREELHDMLEEGARIAIPVVGLRQPNGRDGTTTILTWGSGLRLYETSVRWWSEGPPEWSELIAWTRRYRGLF